MTSGFWGKRPIKFSAFPVEERETEKGVHMKVAKLIGQLWKDDRGQTTTEYILMLSVVVMIAMKFRQVFGTKMGEMVEKVTNKVEGEIDAR